jgi:hypothetical protein
LTVADFIKMASEKTGIDLDESDFKKCIMHFRDGHWEEQDLEQDMSNLNDFGLIMTRKRVIKKFTKNLEDDSISSAKRTPNKREPSPKPIINESSHKRKKDDFEMQVLSYMIEQTEFVKLIHKKVNNIEKEILQIASKFNERLDV